MILLEFNNNRVELLKGTYENDRLGINMLDCATKDIMCSLTVNIPEAMFFGEVLEDTNTNEALVNHIDGFDYDFILQWLEDNDLIEDNTFVGEIQSGFNFYKGVEFKSNVISNMRSIDEY
jgi:hypothetical protein